MAAYRRFEKRCLMEVEPSPTDLSAHRDLMNTMIFCADSIVSAANRNLEINFHLESSEKEALRSSIDLISRHRKILAFEFNGWHGLLSKEQLTQVTRMLRGGSQQAALALRSLSGTA